MGQVISVDQQIINIAKTWYTDGKFENLLSRCSPATRKIKKERIGGKTYNFAGIYGRGGAVSGDCTVAITQAATGPSNAEFSVGPGKIFSVFNLTLLEQLATKEARGAYVPALVDKFFASTDALRKTFAACFYGSGFGEIGHPPVGGIACIIGDTTFVADSYDLVMKIDVGSVLRYTNGAYPSDALFAVVSTVKAIDGLSVTVTSTAIQAVPATAWIELQGARDGSGNPNMPTGLGGWLPAYDDRTGAPWIAYIGTSFMGVNRSIAVDRLAGNYYENTGAQDIADCIVAGLAKSRRQGGNPDMVILNDEDFATMIDEMKANTTYFQAINTTPASSGANIVQTGLSEAGFQFSTNWLKYVIDDPFCPKGYAYILDSEVVFFRGFTKADIASDDGISGNNPGTQSVNEISAPGVNQYALLIEDYLTVNPSTPTSDGPGAQVIMNLFGNFMVTNPAHCTVVKVV